MSAFDYEKMIAELDAQDAKWEAELAALGLTNLADMDVWEGYPEIVLAAHKASDEEIVGQLEKLIQLGADVNARSPHGDTALMQCFARSAFDAMRVLINNGADHSLFDWTQVDVGIIMGDVPDVAANSPALMRRNGGGRTPFLQACRCSNIPAAAYLEPLTPEAGKYDEPDGDGPVMMAALSGSVEMLEWVLTRGYDVNAQDIFGGTALLEAVERENLEIAQVLLEAGADAKLGRNQTQSHDTPSDNDESASVFAKAASAIIESTAKLMPDVFKGMDDFIVTPANLAQSPEMLRLLARFGLPLEQFDSEDISVVTGADEIPETEVTPEMFNLQSMVRSGNSNPERVDIPFWREQIRTGRSGYAGEVACVGERKYHAHNAPVWSFQRFGRTGTRLPDGRWVLIAGEHEDYYDRDFCIYADVTIVHPDASVDHYIYPADVFPPTDFHTATFLGDHILLIGSLGYQGQRPSEQTQVLRLNFDDFSIEKVETSGHNPGWISKHHAVAQDGHIIVSGGKVEPGHVENTGTFTLDLATMIWSRAA